MSKSRSKWGQANFQENKIVHETDHQSYCYGCDLINSGKQGVFRRLFFSHGLRRKTAVGALEADMRLLDPRRVNFFIFSRIFLFWFIAITNILIVTKLPP